jgi:hypothetical protein
MTGNVSLGSREVSAGRPCLVIAEAGVNHNGCRALGLRLVAAAAAAGADAVKFQTFSAERLGPFRFFGVQGSLGPPRRRAIPFGRLPEISISTPNPSDRIVRDCSPDLGVVLIMGGVGEEARWLPALRRTATKG